MKEKEGKVCWGGRDEGIRAKMRLKSSLGLEMKLGVTLDTLRTMDCDLSWEKGKTQLQLL